MAEQIYENAPSRPFASIERFTPAVLLPLAVLFGVVAQFLFFRNALGVNVGIATGLLLVAAWSLRPAGARTDRLDLWIAPAALVFALLPALRSDVMLLLFDVPAAVVLTAMAAVSFAGAPLTRRALDVLLVLGLAVAGRLLAGGATLLAALPDLGRPLARRTGGRSTSIGVGIALAAPFVIVFAVLFSSADAVFSSALENVIDFRKWSLADVIGRTVLAATFAWLAGGLFLVAGRGADTRTTSFLPRIRGALSSTAGTTALLTVDALFVFFVVVQIAYLFGGLDTLAASGLTYSAYARRGFFELIAVAIIAGSLLVGVEHVVARRTPLYLAALLMLLAGTLIVVVSAGYRMHLYQLAYGWTEQRFYVFAGIAWLGLCAIAAAISVTRDASRWLLHSAGLLGLAVALGVNLIGPAQFVARQNLERVIDPTSLPSDADRTLDARYLVSLGDGAMPTVIESLPRLPSASRELLGSYIRTYVLSQYERDAGPWQALSVDRERARQAVISAADDLRRYPPFR